MNYSNTFSRNPLKAPFACFIIAIFFINFVASFFLVDLFHAVKGEESTTINLETPADYPQMKGCL